jgi:hypothetical protein
MHEAPFLINTLLQRIRVNLTIGLRPRLAAGFFS